tara:strand:- start:9999 stop:10760 length:762 start_codon:yes stop_codon:yes gene_type:complete
MHKYHFIFDKTKRSQSLKKSLRRYKNYPIKNSDTIVVAGGDGFMIRTIKKYYKAQKSFYGINCGTIGFLMNRHQVGDLDRKIKRAKKFLIHPLQIEVQNLNGKKSKILAINEISLLRQGKQTAILKLKSNSNILIKRLIGDGILVSTPAGSTAYNLSVHGPILSLDSKKIAITPISPFRPRRWKGKVLSERSNVFIQNLDPNKRPVAAVADNFEIRNIKSIKIKSNKKISFKLLFNAGESLIKKIKLEQRKLS